MVNVIEDKVRIHCRTCVTYKIFKTAYCAIIKPTNYFMPHVYDLRLSFIYSYLEAPLLFNTLYSFCQLVKYDF